MTAPPASPAWSTHLPSYPPRVTCRFFFEDSHELKNTRAGTVRKNLTAVKSDMNELPENEEPDSSSFC
jgi:hypothetical protein